MGDVRAYDPTPPQQEKVDLNNFPLKMAELKVDNSQKGMRKYRVSLSNEIRAAHLSDPAHAGDWRSLILDFDKKLLFLASSSSRLFEFSIPLLANIANSFKKWYQNSCLNLTKQTSCHLPRFCDNLRAPTPAETEAQLVPVEEPTPDAFTSEPSNLDALLEEYYVENKVPGRDPGTTLLLTVATSRSGKTSEIVANQKFKLFLVP